MTDTSEFAVDVDMNPYLVDSAADVDAIVTVTASGDQARDPEWRPDAVDSVEVIIIDCSSSMYGARLGAARQATRAAIAELRDGVSFAVLAGTQEAAVVYPPSRVGATAVAGDATRAEASEAVGQLRARGGTAIGSWLRLTSRIVERHPGSIKHAILLTDGRNEHEDDRTLHAALEACRGRSVATATVSVRTGRSRSCDYRLRAAGHRRHRRGPGRSGRGLLDDHKFGDG